MSDESIFAGAVEQPTPDKQAAFLDAACAGDAQLRARMESLVRAHEHPDPFFDGLGKERLVQQGSAELQATLDRQATELPGTVVGPYKLLEQVGEGGMGVVYVADQIEPVRRRVALKVIKPGMDTKQVIARFEAERQALAMMDHGESDLRNFEWYYLYKVSHAEVLTIQDDARSMENVAYSPDGKHLAGVVYEPRTREGTVKVWDSQTGEPLWAIPLRGASAVAFSPDGTRLGTARALWDDQQSAYVGGEVKVLDAQT